MGNCFGLHRRRGADDVSANTAEVSLSEPERFCPVCPHGMIGVENTERSRLALAEYEVSKAPKLKRTQDGENSLLCCIAVTN